MIQQPKDKLAAARDKREWNEIRRDQDYWNSFWIWKNATTCPSGNVFKFKESAHG